MELPLKKKSLCGKKGLFGCATAKSLVDTIYFLITHMKKFLDSDWLRAVQFFGKRVQKKGNQVQKKGNQMRI